MYPNDATDVSAQAGGSWNLNPGVNVSLWDVQQELLRQTQAQGVEAGNNVPPGAAPPGNVPATGSAQPSAPQVPHPVGAQVNPLAGLLALIAGAVSPHAAGQFVNATVQGGLEAARQENLRRMQQYQLAFQQAIENNRIEIQRKEAEARIAQENRVIQYRRSAAEHARDMKLARERAQQTATMKKKRSSALTPNP